MIRIGRPVLPAQAQMQLELCRQLQDGHCTLVASQRISWLQVCCSLSLPSSYFVPSTLQAAFQPP